MNPNTQKDSSEMSSTLFDKPRKRAGARDGERGRRAELRSILVLFVAYLGD